MNVTYFNLKNKNYTKKSLIFIFQNFPSPSSLDLNFFDLRDFNANYNEQIFLFHFKKDFKKINLTSVSKAKKLSTNNWLLL
jgi:hypothetical protein